LHQADILALQEISTCDAKILFTKCLKGFKMDEWDYFCKPELKKDSSQGPNLDCVTWLLFKKQSFEAVDRFTSHRISPEKNDDIEKIVELHHVSKALKENIFCRLLLIKLKDKRSG
jgi:hypothetical protein